MNRRFDPEELGEGAGREELLGIARELEALGRADLSVPSRDFADRVMRAVERERRPSPIGAFGAALLGGSPRGAVAAVAVAWRLATRAGRAVPLAVRAQALAFVLVVAVAAVGTGTLAVAGAAQVLGGNGILFPSGPTPSPTLTIQPSPTPEPTPMPTPEATPSAEPSAEPSETPSAEPSAEPSETPSAEPSAEPSETPKPSPTPTPTPEPGESSASPDASGSETADRDAG